MRNEQKEPEKFEMKDAFNIVFLLATAHSLCITPFIRTGFGIEAFGVPALVACAIMLLYAGLAPAPAMYFYFVAWLVAVIIQRIGSFKAENERRIVHSRYQGWPALAMRLVPFVKRESTAKLLIEPMLCIAVGTFLCPISTAVGGFVIIGYISLILTTGIQRQVMRARVRQIRDAQIEQQQLMEHVNGHSDEF